MTMSPRVGIPKSEIKWQNFYVTVENTLRRKSGYTFFSNFNNGLKFV